MNNRKAIILLLVGIYLTTYVGVRIQHILIHRASYATTDEENIELFHSVTTGDFGIPMLTGIGIWRLASVCYFIYTPLRLPEALFWHIYPRDYGFKAKEL